MPIVRLFIILMALTTSLFGQKMGYSLPEIQNFSRYDYKGGTQTWDIINISKNRVAVANNDGLIIFDGHKWEKCTLPNKTILRSIAFDSKTQRIYTGGQDELGFFQPDEKGILKYHDLKSTIPEAFRQLEDVWNIKFVGSTLYFRSINRIYAYNNSQWKVYSTKESNCLVQVGNAVVYNNKEKGLFKVEGGNSLFIKGSDILKNKTITHIILIKDEWYVFSEKDGMFKYHKDQWQSPNTSENKFLKINRVHSACKVNDSLMAIGTYLNGIIILNQNFKSVLTLGKDNGLQNNNISSLFYSSNQQLWAGTYNGIDMIDWGNSFRNLYPDGSLQGAVYATAIYDQKLYCGTENGLYYKELKTSMSNNFESEFKFVKNTEGQVWGLDVVLGDLIMSHNDGAFVVKENSAQKISSYNGSWKFLDFEEGQYCIAGSYIGLHVFKKQNGKWTEGGKIAGFDESCRIMVKDGNKIWVSHPYRGLFRINVNIDKFSADIENFGQINGLPGNFRNTVYNIENQIIVSNDVGLYKFDPKKNKFSHFKLPGVNTEINSPIKDIEVMDHKLWLATEKHLYSIQFDNGFFDSKKYQSNVLELKNYLVPGFEKIFPLESNAALLLTTKGLKYFQKSSLSIKVPEVYVSKIFDINSQSLVAEGFDLKDTSSKSYPRFAYTSNALLFDFASNTCKNDIRYRYQLNPIQKEWSTWESKSQKEFNNLPPGTYDLKIEGSDIYGNVSPPYIYTFEILAPWYKSKIAQIIYILSGILLILYSRRRLVKKYEQITIDLEEQKNESEALVLQLQKEKLEAEILFKNKELGLSSMHLVQKNEAIGKLKSELNKVIKKINDPEVKKELKSMVSILSDDERLEDDWQSFAQNFDAAHNDFITKLKQIYPNLTPNDLKLCAYLKLNLTTKDIAPILNISVRGVEISRYRLRKKLNLSNEENLNDFIMRI